MYSVLGILDADALGSWLAWVGGWCISVFTVDCYSLVHVGAFCGRVIGGLGLRHNLTTSQGLGSFGGVVLDSKVVIGYS